MAVPVDRLTPQIHLKAVRSKEIPMQQFKEHLGLALPASPRSWEQGKLLPSNLLVLAAPLCLPLLGCSSRHGVCLAACRFLKSPGSWDIYPGQLGSSLLLWHMLSLLQWLHPDTCGRAHTSARIQSFEP